MLGRGQPGRGQHPAERAALLGEVDRLRGRAHDRHAGVLEPLRQAERRLAAELADDAGDRAGLELGVVDLEHVLERQRLEVQPRRGVVVGRHRLGVAVDHDRLVAGLAQGQRGVHAGVVELDALADAVRPGAEDDHRRDLARLDLGLLVVGRVVVRRLRRELRGARVDGLEDRADAQRVAHAAHDVLAACCARPRSGRRRSRAAWPGAAAPGSSSAHVRTCSPTSLSSTIWSRNHGSMSVASWTSSIVAPAHSACCTSSSRPSCGTRTDSSRASRRARAGSPDPGEPRVLLLQRAQRLLQRLGEVAPDRHRLADALHVRGELVVGRRELLEREPRDLDHDVVQRRLEAGRVLCLSVVMSLGISSRV